MSFFPRQRFRSDKVFEDGCNLEQESHTVMDDLFCIRIKLEDSLHHSSPEAVCMHACCASNSNVGRIDSLTEDISMGDREDCGLGTHWNRCQTQVCLPPFNCDY